MLTALTAFSVIANAQSKLSKSNLTISTIPVKSSHVILAKSDSSGKIIPDTVIVGDTVLLVKEFIKSITKLQDQKQKLVEALCLPKTLNLTFKSEKDKKRYYRILKENGIYTKTVK